MSITVNKKGGVSNLKTDKIRRTLERACENISHVNVDELYGYVVEHLYDGISTKSIQDLLITSAENLIEKTPEYGKVAAQLFLAKLKKEVLGELQKTNLSYEEQYKLAFISSIQKGVDLKILDPRMLDFDLQKLADFMNPNKDKFFDYMGISVLYNNYLMKDGERRIELPQIFWMRVAMGLALNEENKEEWALQFYSGMSNFFYIPSTPTLFHSGYIKAQMSSCLLSTVEDDLFHIMKVASDNAQLAKYSYGIGTDITNIRAAGALIESTKVESQGSIPFAKIYNDVCVAINRSGKRRGAAMISMEVWHLDFEDFLDLKRNTGDERRRTHDLHTASWIPDLFMQRVEQDGDWTFFSPNEVPELHHIYGKAFKEKYEEYEKLAKEGKIKQHKTIKAKTLYRRMLTNLFETGSGWFTFKDPSNIRSPQDHVGVIHNTNLCCVVGDQIVVCDQGLVTVKELYEQGKVNKVAGKNQIENASPMLLPRPDAPIVKIHTKDGYTHKVTPDHKVWVEKKGYVEAKELVKGDKLSLQSIYHMWGSDNSITPEKAYILGVQMDLDNAEIPQGILKSPKETVRNFIKGALQRCYHTENKSVLFPENWLERVKTIQLLLLNWGIKTQIQSELESEYVQDLKTRGCLQSDKKQYVLCFDRLNYPKIENLFNHSDFIVDGTVKNNFMNTEFSHLEELPNEDAYCLTVYNDDHLWTCNGILTKNTEILENNSKEESANCLAGDTLILTDQGQVQIKDITDHKIYVPFESDEIFNKNPRFVKAKLINQGVKQTYKINLLGSHYIKATQDHKFLVNHNKQYVWKTVKELLPNDKLCVVNETVINNKKTIINKDYLTAGWILGDGWFTNKQIGVVFGQEDILAEQIVVERMKSWHKNTALSKHGTIDKTPEIYTQKNGVKLWTSTKINFVNSLVARFGFKEGKAPVKEIPKEIFNSGFDNIASFLSGLFSADGTVYLKEKPFVALTSASKKLLHQTQMLLKIFNIHSRITFGSVKNRDTFQGQVTIYNKESLKNFKEYINFHLSEQKMAKLDKINKKDYKTSTSNYYKVISVEKSGIEEVYDLGLTEGHHFIANGVVVHNCNLTPLNLSEFVNDGVIDFVQLKYIIETVVRSLDNVIDLNFYPVPEPKVANLRHRPIGMGLMGWQDFLYKLKIPFDSEQSIELADRMTEFITYEAIKASCMLAKERGAYSTFKGSKWDRGIFPLDTLSCLEDERGESLNINRDSWLGKEKWDDLKALVKNYGLRNSNIFAIAPTASSSLILGAYPCIEPIYQNLYTKANKAGEYTIINKYLIDDLRELGLWNDKMLEKIKLNNGSIQKIKEIPENIRNLYKECFEIDPLHQMKITAARMKWVDQSISHNVFFATPNGKKLAELYMQAWKMGMKTTYYLRTLAASQTEKTSIKTTELTQLRGRDTIEEVKACSINNPECESCQ